MARNLGTNTAGCADGTRVVAPRRRSIEPGTPGDVVERAQIGSGGAVAVTDGGDTTDDSAGSDDETATDSNGTLAIATINADAAGDDRETLNDEYIVFENEGTETLDVSGWTVEDEVGKRYAMPDGVTLAPDETLTLRTGSGTDTERGTLLGLRLAADLEQRRRHRDRHKHYRGPRS